MLSIWHLYIPLLVLALHCSALSSRAEDTKTSPPTGNEERSPLAEVFLAKKMLPQVQIAGRFEFFSAIPADSETQEPTNTLHPMSSSDFRGVIDLASRRVQFDFKGYKKPILGAPEPFHVADYSVTFDGEKWLLVQVPSKEEGLPKGITSFSEVTSERPVMFLKSLDPFCFPIFGALADVRFNEEQLHLLQVLGGEGKGLAKIDFTQKGNDAIFTVVSECIIDKFTFDSSKAYALTRRETNFNGCDQPDADPAKKLRNEVVVSELTPSGGLWLPKKAEFTQYMGDKVMIKRRFEMSEAKVLSHVERFSAVIPPNSIVIDKRFGITFKTSDTAPKGKSEGVQKNK
jgi:hypothetical protein